MNRKRELVDILNKASKAYYSLNDEIMSNYEYDKLYDELVKLEKESGEVYPDSPTLSVGYETISSLTKVTHETRMLSLDKTKEISKLKEFLGNELGLVSWKLDGLTIVLKYDKGELLQAVTRGNGEVGEDVTHNARHFYGVPLRIDYQGPVTLRGEAVISYEEFERINESLEEDLKYKNPRNLCSGTVRQLNSEILKNRKVMFNVFSVIGDVREIEDSKKKAFEWAKLMGFNTVEYKMTNAGTIEKDVEYFKENVDNYPIPSDGLVLTYDSISYSNSLGATAKFPRDSIAFKWKDEIKETKLLEIGWNTSRTGLINPVAIFEPVELEGTTVNRASLHNLSIVKSLELGVSDIVTVYKANMIIPQIADNITRSNTFTVPENCNVCGGKTEINAQNGVEVLLCTNPNCKAQQVKALTHFTSRDAMNIEGLSEATIQKFVDKGFIKYYPDIFNLKDFGEEIKEMEGFGEKSLSNLLESVEKSKTCRLHNFIYALGINHIGLQNAKLMCAHYDDEYVKVFNAKADELVEISGFGLIMANAVSDYFAVAENMEMAIKTAEILNIERIEKGESPLNGKVFVITGSLNQFENRKVLQAFIEEKGGKVSSSVSANTSYLINNDNFSNSAKNKKAKELGVEIISEEEFVKEFGGKEIRGKEIRD